MGDVSVCKGSGLRHQTESGRECVTPKGRTRAPANEPSALCNCQQRVTTGESLSFALNFRLHSTLAVDDCQSNKCQKYLPSLLLSSGPSRRQNTHHQCCRLQAVFWQYFAAAFAFSHP